MALQRRSPTNRMTAAELEYVLDTMLAQAYRVDSCSLQAMQPCCEKL